MGIEESRAAWEAAAPGWARWEPTVAQWMAPATARMLDRAGIVSGSRVIDVACGAGSQSVAAARRSAPGGTVTATDIAETMLRHVREQAAREGVTGLRTLASAAEDLPVEAGSFDAAICQLGLMLFHEPGRALDAIARVLRPGGRIALVVFTTPADNPMMAKPMQVLLRHAGKSPPAPGQPGLFSLGAPGRLEQLLAQAGFEAVVVEPVDLVLRMPDAGHALAMMQEAFGAYRAVVADQSATVQAAAWDEVRQCLEGFEGSDGFQAPSRVLVASGLRP